MVFDCYIEACLILDLRELKKHPALFKTTKQIFKYKNPKYLENEKWGYSNHNVDPELKSYEIDGNDLKISRGGLEKLQEHFKKFNATLNLIDRTYVSKSIEFEQSNTILRKDQQHYIDVLSQYTNGCGMGYTSFGKTIVSAELIRKLKQRTTILVHTTFLQKQWIAELTDSKLFNIDPKRIGGVGGIFTTKKDFYTTMPTEIKYKNKIVNDINVCLYHSMCNPKHLQDFERDTGCVIFDEGQKTPIEGIQKVVNHFRARYRYACSANFKRKDGKEFLTFDTFGPVRVKIAETNSASKILSKVNIVPSPFETEYDSYGEMLIKAGMDKQRNILICKTVIRKVKEGKLCMIFVERKAQAVLLFRMLSNFKVDMLLGPTNWKDYSLPHLRKKWAAKNKRVPEMAEYAAKNLSPKALAVLKNYDHTAAFDRIKRLADRKKLQIIIGTQKAEVGLSIRALDYGCITTPVGNNPERFNQIKGRFERTYSDEQEEFFGHKKPEPQIDVICDYKIKNSREAADAIREIYKGQVSTTKRKVKVIKRRTE